MNARRQAQGLASNMQLILAITGAAAFFAGAFIGSLEPSPVARQESRIILVVYTADWCEPCRRLKADIENNPEVLRGVAVEYRDGAEVDRVPDIRLMDGNVLVRRKVGYTDLKSFSEWLNADVL